MLLYLLSDSPLVLYYSSSSFQPPQLQTNTSPINPSNPITQPPSSPSRFVKPKQASKQQKLATPAMAPPRCTALMLASLLLFFLCISATEAARTGSGQPIQEQEQHGEVEEETTAASLAEVEERCGGGGGEGDQEECLMRRTLVAHTDYIYTQGNHN